MAIQQRELANGLCVIVEEMDHVESAAYELSIPGGLISDPEANIGASLVLAELIGKGAGSYDTRGLSEAFDSAGIRHGEGAGTDRFSLSGVLVANQIERALELVTAMVREPKLPKEDIEPIASILLQDLDSLKDNPARRAMVELSSRFYPAPFNRCPMGEPDGIAGCDRDLLQRMHADMFRPNGAILSIAGKVSAEKIFATVTELLGDWSGVAIDLPKFGTRPKHEYFHLTEKSAQAQIVMASPSAKFSDPLYYESKLVASILGSSMFGRLFVEVREKRGLCYSVYARHGSNLQYGTLSAYVGTTPERAQESMDVVLNEFEKLPGTITQEELDRSRTNLKSSLIMGEESPGSRASSNASDWWLIKRVRGLEEIKSAIDSVTLDSINQFLKKYPFRPCSVLTLGSAPLKVPASVFTGQAQ